MASAINKLKSLSSGATAGNANADFTVPSGTVYNLNHGFIALTPNASVADRTIVVQILDTDGSTVLDEIAAGASTPADTDLNLSMYPGVSRETSAIAGTIQAPLPSHVLLPGQKLRVSITNGVSGDSFTAYFQVKQSAD